MSKELSSESVQELSKDCERHDDDSCNINKSPTALFHKNLFVSYQDP